MQILETERLKLIPFSLELKRLTMHDRTRMARMLAIRLSDDWPAADYLEALPTFIRRAEQDPSSATWDGIIVHKVDRIAIGGMGFHGGPDETGAIELGYDIVPTYRNCGYATEMAQRLLSWAFTQPGVTTVTAYCAFDNISSIRVLEKAGMQRISIKDDMLYWETGRNA